MQLLHYTEEGGLERQGDELDPGFSRPPCVLKERTELVLHMAAEALDDGGAERQLLAGRLRGLHATLPREKMKF